MATIPSTYIDQPYHPIIRWHEHDGQVVHIPVGSFNRVEPLPDHHYQLKNKFSLGLFHQFQKHQFIQSLQEGTSMGINRATDILAAVFHYATLSKEVISSLWLSAEIN